MKTVWRGWAEIVFSLGYEDSIASEILAQAVADGLIPVRHPLDRSGSGGNVTPTPMGAEYEVPENADDYAELFRAAKTVIRLRRDDEARSRRG